MLVKQAHARLDTAGKIYHLAIYDRLLNINQQLENTIQQLTIGTTPTVTKENFGGQIVSLASLDLSEGHPKPLFGEAIKIEKPGAAALMHLSKGLPILTVQPNGQNTRILLSRVQNPKKQGSNIIIAEIAFDYLWGDPENFAQDINLCVLNNQYIQLFCTLSLPTESMQQAMLELPQSMKGEFFWQQNDENFIANYQEVFLEANFLSPRWLVVATQPEVDALGAMKSFNMIFWGSVTLAVLLILFFSMIQIRRVLVPLEKLIEGTRRLANNDFDTTVNVTSQDEFGELATSFNTMRVRLGNQFETLTALSEIDREILSGLNIEKIARQVLVYLQKMPRVELVSISVFDFDDPKKTNIYILDKQDGPLKVYQLLTSDKLLASLVSHEKGLWTSGKLAQKLVPNEELNATISNCFILPLNWQDQTVGFISLGTHEKVNWQVADMNRIQDYADRVAVALFSKNREELLLRQARIDSLTGLPNRFLFMEQLQKEMAQAQRTNRKLAVLYLDLDRFKKVNDSYGHATGDKLLCEAGERLYHCVREGDTVARLGGDEFSIIISGADSEHHIRLIAEQAVSALAKPFIIDGEENIIAASIGIAIYPQDGESITDLMRNADIAMYRTKEKNGNQYIFFEESMNDEVIKRAKIERELRTAIAEQQFILHYQPQVDPKTNKVRGVEALVRWNHPEQGVISPFHFITVAEDTGLITDIGNIILAEACKQFCAWTHQGIDLEYVAVNVSVKQFLSADFSETVITELKSNNMPAHCLELEITESVLMDDTNVVLDMLHQFQQLGIQLSIDDFGTGYSSMSYLEQLPFDTLKIDMSFIRKIQENGEGGTIAATIAAMAHALNKQVVAEGVETSAQLDFLREHNCELIQGYFFSCPLPAAELAAYVKETNKVLETTNFLQTG